MDRPLLLVFVPTGLVPMQVALKFDILFEWESSYKW